MKKLILLLACALSGLNTVAAQDTGMALRLEEAQRIALDGNHDLRLALTALRNAQAGVRSADVGPNPLLTLQTININPAQGVGSGPLRNKAVDTTVRLDQQIERGGKRALRVENAQLLEQAARNDLGDVRRQMRLAVAQAYYDLLEAQERRDIVRETASLYDRTREAAVQRRKAGDIAGADVARIEVDALRAANDVNQVEAEVRRAQQTLALALGGLAGASSLRATDAWPAADPDLAYDAMADAAIANRADVRAAEARVRAADAALRLALALRTRDVTVGVQAEHWPQNGANTQGSGNSFGVSIQIPLFVQNQFQGEIRSAQAAADNAAVALEKVRAGARGELAVSASDARQAAIRLRRYDTELLAASAKSADAAEYAFRNGAAGVMDVLDARRTRRATLLEAAAARADHAKALAAWEAAKSNASGDQP